MNKKVELIYENNEYSIIINGTLLNKDNDLEKALNEFKNVIRNNKTAETRAWDEIVEKFNSLNNTNLNINCEFRTMSYGNIKYFYNTGRVFYIANNSMIPLIGGYQIFKFILTVVCDGNIEKANDFIEFCKDITLSKVKYRVTETSLIVSSAIFNYGAAEYNFNSRKINKGASIMDGSFEEFKKYISEIINIK